MRCLFFSSGGGDAEVVENERVNVGVFVNYLCNGLSGSMSGFAVDAY